MKQHLRKFVSAFIIAYSSLIGVLKTFAQVNYEYTYPWLTQNWWFLTNLGNDNYKYVVENDSASQFSLYNLNHTPYMLNIQIPIPMHDTINNAYYRLGYITTSLFDCDSTNIEYAIMLDTPKPQCHPNTAIYRTDGTLIFSKDTVGTMMCYGCGSGSYEVHPIMNTPVGAKLYLFNQDGVFVYGLCDYLPEMIEEINNTGNFVQVSPNPSSDKINFDITLPSSFEEYELTIFNSNFQTVKTTAIKGMKTEFNFDCEIVVSGTYFYSLQNKNKLFQTGKFVVTK